MDNRLIFFKNVQLCYRVYGSGKAVVLIHGFAEDGNIWNYLTDKLKKSYQVIVPDLPGSGKSPILQDSDAQISIEDYAEFIISILKKESLKECTVIGHSMGGYITLAIADKYPHLLNGFGLFNSTAYADTENKKRDRLKSIEFIEKNEVASFLKASISGLFSDTFKKKNPIYIEGIIDSVNYFSSEALVQYQKAMINRPERTDVLKKTSLAVLFIIGEKDPAIPLEKSLVQCHLSLVSHVYIFPGMGHMGMLEEKELCAQAVLSYLGSL